MVLMLSLGVCNAQPIEFVVSASPGGPNDTVTRKVMDQLERRTSLQFVIVNKPGAAHTIAYNYLASSNKPSVIMETPEIESNAVFPLVDELYNAGHFVNTVFVSEKSGIKNMHQLMAIAKNRSIIFGHGGVGSYSYMAMEIVCKGIQCLDVPYKSGAEGMMAILTGTIDAYALASYGSKQYRENERYVAIHDVRISKSKSWYKLFGRNLSDRDKAAIIQAMQSIDTKFYTDLGLEK